jgi:hypothetical protein
MLPAWLDCAALLEWHLYNLNLPPATSPRVSPLGERRLVYQIFKYAGVWPVDKQLIHMPISAEGNAYEISCHDNAIYVFENPNILHKYKKNHTFGV